ncbi:MAG TPA: helix-turn-helix domain-containing protein [Casimicrobiaceae bacterium]|nr:helix-turn-helix domain-containing protein [Casimicrobiaceae bacterium]
MAGRAGKPVVQAGASRTDLASELQALGFSDYEARTYLTLLQCSPATAYEVSKLSGLPRSNTYGALESCTKKGAVQPISQAPVRYVPVDPRVLLNRIADDTSLHCAQLASRLAQIKMDESRDFVWEIDGEKKVNAKISEMIATARKHIWIKAHQSLVDEHYPELRAAAARGVSILIILFGDDAARFRFGEHVRVYLHEGNGVRVGSADNLFTITTDFNTALTAKMQGDVHAAYTRNESIVTMAESLIRHDMYLAEIFEKFGPQIDAAFGPFLVSLRHRYFSPQQLVGLNHTLERLFPGSASGHANGDKSRDGT